MVYCIKNCRILSGDNSGIIYGSLVFEHNGKNSRIVSVGKDLPADKNIDAGGAFVMPAFTDIGPKLYDSRYQSRDSQITASAALTAGGYRRAVVFPYRDTLDKPFDDRIRYASKITSAEDIKEGQIYYTESGRFELSELYTILSVCREKESLYISSGIDMKAVGNGSVALGIASKMNNCEGITRSCEYAVIANELSVAYETGARLHINAVSCRESLELVTFFKKKGAKVSCGVSPFHLAMTDSDTIFFGANGKILPPLRSEKDRDALREGVYNGDIDCICSLHEPLTKLEKNHPIPLSPFGVCGIETTASTLVTYMPELLNECPHRIPQLLCLFPAALIGEDVSLNVESRADFVIFDASCEIVVSENTLKSKSVNTPFLGQTLNGYVKALYVDGIRY